MKIIKCFEWRGQLYSGTPRTGLNMRQLLNPIFFCPVRRHPDMKRQPSRRQRSRDLAAARRLKLEAQYVPLCKVDRTVYRVEYDWHLDREVVRPYELGAAIGGRL
jgi:hypothetical protein